MTSNSRLSKGISLSFCVAIWTALAIGLSMAVYALFQYFYLPGMSIKELVIHHLWHVVVLGAVIHLSCWLIFHYILIRPINQIYVHLYQLGKGQVENLTVVSSVKELQIIVEGINVMIWKMEKWMSPLAIENAHKEIQAIALIATQLRMENKEVAEAITKRVESLEASLFTMVDKQEEMNDSIQLNQTGSKDES